MLDLISSCGRRGRPHFIRFQLFQRLKEVPRRCRADWGRDFAAASRFLPSVTLLSTFSPSTASRVSLAAGRNVPRRPWRHSFYIWRELMNQPSLSSHFYRVRRRGSEGVDSRIPYTFIFIIPPHNNHLCKPYIS
jgi:hypothetical protein